MGWLKTLKLQSTSPLPRHEVTGQLKVKWHFRIAEIHEDTVRILWWDGKGFQDIELPEGAQFSFTADLDVK